MDTLETTVSIIHESFSKIAIPFLVLGTEVRSGVKFIFMKQGDSVFSSARQLKAFQTKQYGSEEEFWKCYMAGKCHVFNESVAISLHDSGVETRIVSVRLAPKVFDALKKRVFVYPPKYVKRMDILPKWVDWLNFPIHTMVRIGEKFLDLAAAPYGSSDDDLKLGVPNIYREWGKIPFLEGAKIVSEISVPNRIVELKSDDNQSTFILKAVENVRAYKRRK